MKLAWWRWSALLLAVVLMDVAGSTTVVAQDQSSAAVAQKKENQKTSKHSAKAAHFGNNKRPQVTPGDTSKPPEAVTKPAMSHNNVNNGTLMTAKKTEVSKGKKQASKAASKDSKKKPNAAKKGDTKFKQ